MLKRIVLIISMLTLLSISCFAEIDTSQIVSPKFFISINDVEIEKDKLEEDILIYNGVLYFPLNEAFTSVFGLTVETGEHLEINLIPKKKLEYKERVTKALLDLPVEVVKSVQIHNKAYKNDDYPFIKKGEIVYIPLTWDITRNYLGIVQTWDESYGMKLFIKELHEPINSTSVTFGNLKKEGGTAYHTVVINRDELPDSMMNFKKMRVLGTSGINSEEAFGSIAYGYKNRAGSKADYDETMSYGSYQEETVIMLYDENVNPLGYAWFKGKFDEGVLKLTFNEMPKDKKIPFIKNFISIENDMLKINLDKISNYERLNGTVKMVVRRVPSDNDYVHIGSVINSIMRERYINKFELQSEIQLNKIEGSTQELDYSVALIDVYDNVLAVSSTDEFENLANTKVVNTISLTPMSKLELAINTLRKKGFYENEVNNSTDSIELLNSENYIIKVENASLELSINEEVDIKKLKLVIDTCNELSLYINDDFKKQLNLFIDNELKNEVIMVNGEMRTVSNAYSLLTNEDLAGRYGFSFFEGDKSLIIKMKD